MRGPRFEQTNMELQPTPLSAMQLISEEPIRLVEQRIASCDGGEPFFVAQSLPNADVVPP